MAELQILEGTGRELLPQLEQYPDIRFRRVPLLDEHQEAKPRKELKGRGMLKGMGTLEDFLRRKREDLE